MSWRNYSLIIPEEDGIAERSDFTIHKDSDSYYWPFLWFRRNRDLIRLVCLDREDKVVLDGEEIKAGEIQERIGNYQFVHPRPDSLIREVGSSDDLLLLAAHDICQDVYCDPFMLAWDDIGHPLHVLWDIKAS